MILRGGKLEATYEREIERKPLNNVLFYGGLAVGIFLIVFTFGIRPTALALAQNQAYEKELVQIRDAMKMKLTQIQNSEALISRNMAGINALNAAIPNNTDLQGFLAQLVLKAADTGFAVERVKESETTGDIIKVDVETTGEISNLASFVRGIEELDRFVTIQDMRLDTDGPIASVRFRLEIYKL